MFLLSVDGTVAVHRMRQFQANTRKPQTCFGLPRTSPAGAKEPSPGREAWVNGKATTSPGGRDTSRERTLGRIARHVFSIIQQIPVRSFAFGDALPANQYISQQSTRSKN